jgi:hypothetical protein
MRRGIDIGYGKQDHLMKDPTIMSNRVIKPLSILILTGLLIFWGQGGFSSQGNEESKVIFIVR